MPKIARHPAYTASVLTLILPSIALAQGTSPPPGYAYPPPAYGYPPPGYGYPPPGYGYPPPGYAPTPYGYQTTPAERPRWKPGDPVPSGYHVEEGPLSGLVIAGALSLGIPYFIGSSFAGASGFANGSGWLLIPLVGPWLTIGARENRCTEANTSGECGTHALVTTLLALDGIAQSAGTVMLTLGILLKRERLVPNRTVLLTPAQFGRDGHGVALVGSF